MLFKKVLSELTEKIKPDTPSPYKLADETDEDGWDRARDGLMADAGMADNAVVTERYEADA
jgi:hypothetical protein